MHATLSFYLACLLKIVKLVLCVDLVGNKCNLAVFCSSLRPCQSALFLNLQSILWSVIVEIL